MKLSSRVLLAWACMGMGEAYCQISPSSPSTSPENTVKAEGYQFDPNSVIRDPFEAPFFEDPSESEEDEIIRYDIRDIKLVAIMKGAGASKVMVRVNNHFHILQVGDMMGKARDTIFKIEDEAITMEKVLKDFKGNKKSQLYKLELDPKKK